MKKMCCNCKMSDGLHTRCSGCDDIICKNCGQYIYEVIYCYTCFMSKLEEKLVVGGGQHE